MSSDLSMNMQETSIIQANDLGKCYKIYDNPNARLKQALWKRHKQYYREFWAIRNINFEVKRGESLGIIGRNGSGKSTLLQLICGTLTATEGELSAQGRIAALLELGSGFNPEFTGLENVYLNATLLGLRKEETDAELDDILAFADIGNFINEPVKSYSSGMTVRLAFAVIAHVHPDILVVDEALAVGDAIFVQRCMRFIRRMREERCLLFVSHDAEAVKSLCSHALWLSEGSTQSYGRCKEVTLNYLRYCQAVSYGEEVLVTATGSEAAQTGVNTATTEQSGQPQRNFQEQIHDYEVMATYYDNLANASGWKTGSAELVEASVRATDKNLDNFILKGGEEIEIVIRAKVYKNLEAPIIGFVLKDKLGQALFGENTLIIEGKTPRVRAKKGDILTAIFVLRLPFLPNGEYMLMASIANSILGSHTQHCWLEDAALVIVHSSQVRHGLVGALITKTSLTNDTS